MGQSRSTGKLDAASPVAALLLRWRSQQRELAGTSERLRGTATQRAACLTGKAAAELRRALGCREPGSTQLLSVPLDLRSLQPLASGRSSLDTALRCSLPERIEDWSMQKVSEQLALRRPQMRPYRSDL